MKKLSKLFLLLATLTVALIAAICFAACGDKKDGEDGNADPALFAGVYKVEKYVWDMGAMQRTYNLGDTLDSIQGGAALTDDYFVLTLNADGTCAVSSKMPATLGGVSGDKTGTWKTVGSSGLEISAIDDNSNGNYGYRYSEVDGKITYYFMDSRSQNHTFTLKKS